MTLHVGDEGEKMKGNHLRGACKSAFLKGAESAYVAKHIERRTEIIMAKWREVDR